METSSNNIQTELKVTKNEKHLLTGGGAKKKSIISMF